MSGQRYCCLRLCYVIATVPLSTRNIVSNKNERYCVSRHIFNASTVNNCLLGHSLSWRLLVNLSSRFESTICPVLRVVNPAASSPPSVQCFVLSIQPLRVHHLSSASCCKSSRFESTVCPVLRVVNPAASSPPSVQCFVLSIQPLRVHRLSSASCYQSSRFESTVCPVLRVVNPAASSPPSVQCFVLSIQPLRAHHLSSASCCQSSPIRSNVARFFLLMNHSKPSSSLTPP